MTISKTKIYFSKMILNIDLIYQLGKKKWVKSKKSGGNRLPSEGDFILGRYAQYNKFSAGELAITLIFYLLLLTLSANSEFIYEVLFFIFVNLGEPFSRYMHLISVKQKVALRFAEKGRKTVE